MTMTETLVCVNQQCENVNLGGLVNQTEMPSCVNQQCENVNPSGYVTQLTRSLFALQQKQMLCDVTLTADDGKLLAHSAVLAAASEFICSQFEQLTPTTNEYNMHLPGCDVTTLALVLRLLYTGDVSLQSSGDLDRVLNVCTSLGVNLCDLHNVNITVEEQSSSSKHTTQQLSDSDWSAANSVNDIPSSCHGDLVVTDSVATSPREMFVVIEQQHLQPHPPPASAATSRPTAGLVPSSIGRHACSQCGKRYRSSRYLRAHQLSHAGLKPLLCDSCGRGFYTLVNLKRHVLLKHHTGSVLRHVCDRCGKSFVVASRLRQHMTEMHDESTRRRHSCDICQLTFANAGNLQRHRQLHSEDPRPFNCEKCQRRFTQKSSLNAHQRVHDSDARQRAMCVCPICGKMLSKSTNLRKHLRHHATQPPTTS